MQLAEAFKMIKGLCDNVRCTKQERVAIDEALGTIYQTIAPKPPKEKPTVKE